MESPLSCKHEHPELEKWTSLVIKIVTPSYKNRHPNLQKFHAVLKYHETLSSYIQSNMRFKIHKKKYTLNPTKKSTYRTKSIYMRSLSFKDKHPQS